MVEAINYKGVLKTFREALPIIFREKHTIPLGGQYDS